MEGALPEEIPGPAKVEATGVLGKLSAWLRSLLARKEATSGESGAAAHICGGHRKMIL